MDYNKASEELQGLLAYMDAHIGDVTDISTNLQERIFKVIYNELLLFDTLQGRITAGPDFKKRILLIEQRIYDVLGQNNYADVIDKFTLSFQTIEDMNIALQRDINDLTVAVSKISPIRKLVYEQTKDALTSALAPAYIEPAKMLLMQQATSGAGIQDSIALLEKWNAGELASGKLTQGTPTPNLQQYNTQVARDSAYGLHRNFNNIVKDTYGLTSFIYVGNIIKDSRPLCKHLVGLQRPIKLSELPKLLKAFPEGLYPDTTKDNFLNVCGGYSCRHQALAVR